MGFISDLTAGDLLVGLGTLALAYATFLLVKEERKDSQQIIQENIKSRYASHLSRQLDFYSELMGAFTPLFILHSRPLGANEKMQEYYSEFSSIMSNNNIIVKYERWAKNKLASMLKMYFSLYSTSYKVALEIFHERNPELPPEKELHAFLLSIIKKVNEDHGSLLTTYHTITKPILN